MNIILQNRKQRKANRSLFVIELKGAKFDKFQNITSFEAVKRFSKIKIGEFVGFYKNSIYSVQVWKRDDVHLLGIRRHDQKASCPWSHRQKIKNEILGNDYCAIEFMPPQDEVVDDANMFWIFSGPQIDSVYGNYGGLGSWWGQK